MYRSQDYLDGLTQLPQLTTVEERRAVWRQGLAALATAVAGRQPTPLEGLVPDAVLAGVRVALATGLVDDLAWLSKADAATALFELAAALPPGAEKRDLGRRVFRALHEGDAGTFVTLATSLALASRRALAGPAIRARVALSLRLPIAAGVSADGLALALMSRPELERDWLSALSTGSLPSRRLAARLIERAAREAYNRKAEGDDAGLRVLDRPSVRAAWVRLLGDRESLVWRHVATARGLLASVSSQYADEIERDIDPRHSPTEWRRGAASLAASITHDPGGAPARCRRLMESEVRRRDPGIASAMVFGLVRAGEEEPEASEDLLGLLLVNADVDVIEALVDLRREHAAGSFGTRTAASALERLRAMSPGPDDGLTALREALAEELADAPGTPTEGSPLRAHIAALLLAFAEGRDLKAATQAALAAAVATLGRLERAGDDTPEDRRQAFRCLRELDRGLLETSTLADLLAVSGLDAAGGQAAALPDLLARFTRSIVAREERPLVTADVPHVTLRLRRLRALLHLLDGAAAGPEDAPALRAERVKALRALLLRLDRDAASPLRRTVCAAVARAADAFVRDELCELSDILVAVTSHVRGPADLQVLAEASMEPEVKEMFRASADVAAALEAGAAEDRSLLDTFRGLVDALPAGASVRVEGLRRALAGIALALDAVAKAASLADLRKGEDPSPIERLEESAGYCSQLVSGARRRLGLGQPGKSMPPSGARPTASEALRELDAAIVRALREMDDDLTPALDAALAGVRAELPSGIAEVVARHLGRLRDLPNEGSAAAAVAALVSPADQKLRLPPWLPPSRTLGGFYVLRPLGAGAGGSVFVVRRTEERHDDRAESYALKVPSYNGQAAHSLSEEEFLQLFREEAGALLTVPQHANLAGFVTFDVRTRPKPILVMELVYGPTVERVLDRRALSTATVLSVLDGVAAGLGVMHGVGVGHLDVKPANIILRSQPLAAPATASHLFSLEMLTPTPVLVDFGLAGRKVRPGCASPFFGAPEVWDTDRQRADAPAADVYAFACLAYEMFVGHSLFESDTLPGLVACHLAHDGNPPGLENLRRDGRAGPLADVLSAGLQPHAAGRAGIGDLRAALKSLAPDLESAPWPLGAGT